MSPCVTIKRRYSVIASATPDFADLRWLAGAGLQQPRCFIRDAQCGATNRLCSWAGGDGRLPIAAAAVGMPGRPISSSELSPACERNYEESPDLLQRANI